MTVNLDLAKDVPFLDGVNGKSQFTVRKSSINVNSMMVLIINLLRRTRHKWTDEASKELVSVVGGQAVTFKHFVKCLESPRGQKLLKMRQAITKKTPRSLKNRLYQHYRRVSKAY